MAGFDSTVRLPAWGYWFKILPLSSRHENYDLPDNASTCLVDESGTFKDLFGYDFIT